jgi:phage terminase large subunit GpA-like protein
MNCNLIKGAIDGLIPESRLTVSEWADKNRILSPVAAAEPGAWRTSRTPFLKKIMDCLSVYLSYKKVVVIKGAQLGFTEAGNNWLGYIMDNSPAPTLLVMPTDTAIKKNSKTRIDTMIESTPGLRQKVKIQKSRSGENTIDQKNFPSGVLFMVGANSPVGLSSTPIRNVFLDEVDRYPNDVGGEGSPIDLAEARTRTFAKKKIFEISTPTIAGNSAIEREYLETDQNVYMVPCPHCGEFQELIFDNLVWPAKKYKEAKYKCCSCNELIEELYKPDMLEHGFWKPKCEENINPDIIGFKLTSLYSPYGWMSWADIAKQYENALKDPSKMKVFTNTVLGETYAEESEAPKFENLYNRRESYALNTVPKDVCFLTCGVDIQKDRIELEIVGWCKDKRSYSIDYRVLLGNTSLPEVWADLDKVIYETWVREDGIEMNIRLTCVDAGYNTTEVYNYCRKYPVYKVIPIRGNDHLGIAIAPPKSIDLNRKGKKIGQVKVWNIGVSYLKGELYGWLSLEKNNDIPPPCYCHFPQYDQRYFQGLTAEDYVIVKKQWKKRYERNEPLDCRVYARAASIIVGLDRLQPQQLEALCGNTMAVKKEKTISKKKSNFWG